jgi:hypothetical protein
MTMLALPPPGPPSLADSMTALETTLAGRPQAPGALFAGRLLRLARRELDAGREKGARHAVKRAAWWLSDD